MPPSRRDGAVRCVQLGSQGRCTLTGGWRACEKQAGPLTSVMLGMVLDGYRCAGVEALEAIVSVSTRAVISSTVAVGPGGARSRVGGGIAWPTHFLVVATLGWLAAHPG